MVMQYLGLHQVEYIGAYDGDGTLFGEWRFVPFMDQWAETNRAVAREFLGDETGRLFRAPRRTHNTTTEQRLDPARVDHYLVLLDLPEELRKPLSRLAEREAKVG